MKKLGILIFFLAAGVAFYFFGIHDKKSESKVAGKSQKKNQWASKSQAPKKVFVRRFNDSERELASGQKVVGRNIRLDTSKLPHKKRDPHIKHYIEMDVEINEKPYAIIDGLSVIEKSQLQDQEVIREVGQYFVVKGDQGVEGLRVVRNKNNNMYGVLTGKIVLVPKKGISIDQLVSDYDIELEYSSPEINTYYLNVINNGELFEIIKEIKESGSVQRVESEVIEKTRRRY
jgi:hypothetical protein